MDLERQLILTKDNITVNIDTCVYYRIIDPMVAYYTLSSIQASVAEITYATLRTFTGENTLQDLLEKRQEIADKIEDYVYEKVNKWGIYVEQIFIKDMSLNAELQKSLSMVSKTERLSKAKIISAAADVESAKLMHQAADILNTKAAMQIRYLEVLQMVAGGSGSKIMFMPLSSNEFDS